MKIISAKLGADHITREVISVILVKENGRSYGVPFDPDNTDYQQYLAWLAEGNTPEPAEEQQ